MLDAMALRLCRIGFRLGNQFFTGGSVGDALFDKFVFFGGQVENGQLSCHMNPQRIEGLLVFGLRLGGSMQALPDSKTKTQTISLRIEFLS
ncbi:MAG: hypothetical protein MZV70_23585 [Desulfobacterales bacterium]|nr:hypothetical protein [Desulfobacterales bacterium]